MRVLLTGATGLLGGALLDVLLEGGHEARCLVREGSPRLSHLDPGRVEISRGDAGSARDLTRALRGTDALVHLLRTAPDVVAIRKELLVAMRNTLTLQQVRE